MLNAETDYETLNKLKKLEEDNKRLEESVRVFENAMNTYSGYFFHEEHRWLQPETLPA